MAVTRGKLSVVLLVLQSAFIVIFAFLAEYETSSPRKVSFLNTSTNSMEHKEDMTEDTDFKILKTYPLFQDVHVMIFVGFGFLMTFLKRYGFSSVSFNLLLSAFIVQWATIVHGLLGLEQGKFQLGVDQLLTGDFAAATVLISFGAVLGKTSPLQLIIMAIIEVALFILNEEVGLHIFKAVDVGESMFIHAFGAYFGLAVARVLYNEDVERSKKEGSVYHSDLFSMIGTIFLWIYWPSFNGGATFGDSRNRALINTYFSLAACTVVTFAISSLLDKKGRFDMVHIQNATLAGGVAVGTTADLMIQPWGALLLGCTAGVLSTIGYKFITPFLSSKLKIHDTCGVNNLHGMPGILAGLAGAVAAALASTDTYKDSLYSTFAARVPVANSTELMMLQQAIPGLEPGLGRSGVLQGGYQILALVVTLGIAIGGGLITGFILRLPFFDNPKGNGLFDDGDFWELPEDGYPEIEAESTPKKIYIPDKDVDTRIALV